MERVLEFFAEISKIPRGSGNTDGISEYCVNFAKKRGFEALRDGFNNVIIKKPAAKGCEMAEPVMLQAHLDIVCEKEDGKIFDFASDPIELTEKDGWLTANGTTLGADDGIGVAMIMAVLDSKDLLHPEIEAVFTTDEEMGMDGAIGIDLSGVQSKRLINLDSETADTLTVSCAGGCIAKCFIPLSETAFEGKVYRIGVDGLLGGHSGVDIDKGRANANMLLGRILYSIGDYALCSFSGGDKHNVIPTAAEAVIKCGFDPREKVSDILKEIRCEYGSCDSGIAAECCEIAGDYAAFSSEAADFLTAVPNGVFSMSNDIPGLVRTSLSLAVVKTNGGFLECEFFIRSSSESEKEYLKNKISVISKHFEGKTVFDGEYPAWEYNKDSALLKTMTDTFVGMFGFEPKIEAIHAGLECGIFCGKIKGLECVSICPDILDIHTPNERMELKSLEKAWNYFTEVLKKMGE